MPEQPIAGGPRWLTAARRYVGTREIRGPRNEPRITAWLAKLGAWWSDDETPWCGTFVAAMMAEAGIRLPQHWYRARAWLDWGVALPAPVLGCVVVFERGPTSGHVGFAVGRDALGRILVLGGNQGDEVNVRAFPLQRVLGYRWPASEPLDGAVALEIADDAPPSTGEA